MLLVQAHRDMAPVGWLLNAQWAPSTIVPTPVISNEMDWIVHPARHPMRYVGYIDRDSILQDFIAKLTAFAAR